MAFTIIREKHADIMFAHLLPLNSAEVGNIAVIGNPKHWGAYADHLVKAIDFASIGASVVMANQDDLGYAEGLGMQEAHEILFRASAHTRLRNREMRENELADFTEMKDANHFFIFCTEGILRGPKDDLRFQHIASQAKYCGSHLVFFASTIGAIPREIIANDFITVRLPGETMEGPRSIGTAILDGFVQVGDHLPAKFGS